MVSSTVSRWEERWAGIVIVGTLGVVWCGVVWCGVVWCGVVWCGVVWCGVVWCGVVWCAKGAVTKRQWPGCLAYGNSKTGRRVCVCVLYVVCVCTHLRGGRARPRLWRV